MTNDDPVYYFNGQAVTQADRDEDAKQDARAAKRETDGAARDARTVVDALISAEFDLDLAPDARRVLRDERMTVQPVMHRGNWVRTGEAVIEARRVARMWGVEV